MIKLSSMESEEANDENSAAQAIIKLHRFDDKWRLKAGMFQSYKFCGKCDYTFANLRDSASHQRECSVKDKKLIIYECDICCGKFNSKLSIVIHFNNAEGCECNICGDTFGCKILLSKHYKEKHRKFSCDQCAYVGKSKKLLKDHEIKHTGEYACRLCFSRFECLTTFKHHQATCKVAPNICSICLRTFKRFGDLRRHQIMSRDCRGFECDYCSRHFDRRGKLVKHISIHAKLPCTECNEKFNKRGMPNHMSVKHYIQFISQFKHKCDECRQFFHSERALALHSRVHKRNLIAGPFGCPFGCQEKLSSDDELKKHKAFHIGKSLWKCTHCDYTTNVKDLIRRHMKTLKISLRANQICPLYLINLKRDQKKKAKAQKLKEKQALLN